MVPLPELVFILDFDDSPKLDFSQRSSSHYQQRKIFNISSRGPII